MGLRSVIMNCDDPELLGSRMNALHAEAREGLREHVRRFSNKRLAY